MAYIELEDTTSAEKMRLENTTKVFETTGLYNKMNVYLNANCYRSFWNMQNLQSIPSFLNFSKVVNMQEMFMYDQKLQLNLQTISIDNATDMFRTFFNGFNIINNPICGNKVINFAETYARCYNLKGNPVCGPNVVNMSQTYYECNNLTGPAICGPKVTNLTHGYFHCYNINSAHFGPALNQFAFATYSYQACNNIQCINIDMPNGWRIGAPTWVNSPFYGTDLSKVTNIIFGPNCITVSLCFASATTLTNNINIIMSNNLTNIEEAFTQCTALRGTPVCSVNVTNMYGAYYHCYNLTGSPACENKVTNLVSAYDSCSNLIGDGLCPPSVTNMYGAYYHCYNLTSAHFGPGLSVYQTAGAAYQGCNNIQRINIDMPNGWRIGAPTWSNSPFYGTNLSNVTNIIFGPNCTTASLCFASATTLTNNVNIIMSNNLINMEEAFTQCTVLKGIPVCGVNVTNMYGAYYHCYNLTGSPVCGDKVTNLVSAYDRCSNLTGNGLCPPSVTNMYGAYYYCSNITAAYFGPGLSVYQTAGAAYQGCNNIQYINIDMSNGWRIGAPTWQNSPFYGTNLSNVTNIVFGPNCTTAYLCFNGATTLTNNVNIILGNNLTNICQLFDGCTPLQGQATGGPNIIDMSYAFRSCQTLKMTPFCGSKVTNMFWAYGYCYNLTGSPVCGSAVTNMNATYYDCRNISGNIIIGPLVTDLNNTFFNCTTISTIVIPNATKRITYTYMSNICNRGTYNATKLNIIIENKQTYLDVRTYGTQCFGATFTADAAHAETFVVNGQSFTTKNYAYNATKNIYLYCLT